MPANSAEKLANYTPQDTTKGGHTDKGQPKKSVVIRKRVNLFDSLIIEMRPVSLPGKQLNKSAN